MSKREKSRLGSIVDRGSDFSRDFLSSNLAWGRKIFGFRFASVVPALLNRYTLVGHLHVAGGLVPAVIPHYREASVCKIPLNIPPYKDQHNITISAI